MAFVAIPSFADTILSTMLNFWVMISYSDGNRHWCQHHIHEIPASKGDHSCEVHKPRMVVYLALSFWVDMLLCVQWMVLRRRRINDALRKLLSAHDSGGDLRKLLDFGVKFRRLRLKIRQENEKQSLETHFQTPRRPAQILCMCVN